MKYKLIVLFFCYTCFGYSQQDLLNLNLKQIDSTKSIKTLGNTSKNKKQKKETISINDYKIISHLNDTTIVDTSLTVRKDYKFNYLREDAFDLLAFSNTGQTYNSLSYDFNSSNLLPGFAAQARHFNYQDVEDIYYYNVPTPFTELMFKTTFEQGQLLDSFFTVNTSEQLNVFIGFKGLRSLGKYQNIRTSTRNFKFGISYNSKNKKYNANTHITSQGLSSQENGGLTDEDVINFQSGAEEFDDRSVFDPVFQDAENDLEGTRLYLNHSYKIKDSSNVNSLSIGNVLSFEEKTYDFNQEAPNDFFGTAFVNSDIDDRVVLRESYAELNAKYANNTLGILNFNLSHSNFDYGYNSIAIVLSDTITNRITGNITSIGGGYKNKIEKFEIEGNFGINVTGSLDANFLNAKGKYQLAKNTSLALGVNFNSNAPNYNLLLNQSDYINYNWQNDFENVETKQFKLNLYSQKLANLELDYTTIEHYAYFTRQGENNLVSPIQTEQTINYFRLKAVREIKYKKLALNNTFRYQNVINGEGVLNVPDFNIRSTLYYTDKWFKKALFIQAGLTLSYFTAYNANGYDPLLAEFFTQNETEIGNFPRLDFFVNLKVRQARIFFKAEHFNSSLGDNNFFSAPNYPYRDFVVRFGIVWNFFL